MSTLDGTELSPEQAAQLLGPDDEAMFDEDDLEDEGPDVPLQVKERIEEHLARFEKGAVVEPPESFKVGLTMHACPYLSTL